jgi:hypothetical protein
MAAKQKEYIPLPGRGFARTGISLVARVSSRLYLGKDHLIRVNTSWTESYRRFYYSDILALVVRNTVAFLIWSLVLGFLTALFVLFCVMTSDTGGRITLGIIAAVFGVIMLIHLIKGPTCRVAVQTRLGREDLPSLRRVSTARKVIALLKPRIQAAQGELNVDEVRQGLLPVSHQVLASAQSRKEAVSSYTGSVHAWLFGVMLLEALVLAVNVIQPGTLPAFVIVLVFLAAAVLVVLSLVKQTGSALRGGMRVVTWFSLAHVILGLVAVYILMIYTVISNPKISNNQLAIWKTMFSLQVLQNQGLLMMYAFVIVTAFLLAGSGLILWLGSRSAAPGETAGPPP